MESEVMYTLGQIARCAYPDGAEPELINIILVQPATGLEKIISAPAAKYAGENIERLMSRIPKDLVDPEGGVKAEDQGPFWMGYYQWLSAQNRAQSHGPYELSKAGQALYGERWQTDIARDLGIGDARRVRQWMSGDRPIPTGIWADISRLLRKRGLNALLMSDNLET